MLAAWLCSSACQSHQGRLGNERRQSLGIKLLLRAEGNKAHLAPAPFQLCLLLEQHTVLEPQAHLALKGSDEAKVAAAHAIRHAVANQAPAGVDRLDDVWHALRYEAAQRLGDGLHLWRIAGEKLVRGRRRGGRALRGR